MEKNLENLFEEKRYEAPVELAEQVQNVESEKYNAYCPADGTGGWGCCLPCERTN